jgi:hypothetical protein
MRNILRHDKKVVEDTYSATSHSTLFSHGWKARQNKLEPGTTLSNLKKKS